MLFVWSLNDDLGRSGVKLGQLLTAGCQDHAFQ